VEIEPSGRPFTEHSYQAYGYNFHPVRRHYVIAASSGTWAYTPPDTWQRLMPDPGSYPDLGSDTPLMWGNVVEYDPNVTCGPDTGAIVGIFLRGDGAGVYCYDYATDNWDLVDSRHPPIAFTTDLYCTYDGNQGQHICARGTTGVWSWKYQRTPSWMDLNAPSGVIGQYGVMAIAHDSTHNVTVTGRLASANNSVDLWYYDHVAGAWSDIDDSQLFGPAGLNSAPSTWWNPFVYDATNDVFYFFAVQGVSVHQQGDGGGPGACGSGPNINQACDSDAECLGGRCLADGSTWELRFHNPPLAATGTPASTSTSTLFAPTTAAVTTPTRTPTITTTLTVTPTDTPTCATTRILRVGATRTYTQPSQAAAVAQDCDTIEIDAGNYFGDVARWRANNLIIIGCDSAGNCPPQTRVDRPVLSPCDSTLGGTPSQKCFDINSKGLWELSGTNTTIDGLEFQCATSINIDQNGNPHCGNVYQGDYNDAGIRCDGQGLTVLNSYFHDNDDGILGCSNVCSNIAACTYPPSCECLTDADCPGSTCRHGSVHIENTEFFRNGLGDGATHNVYIGRADALTFKGNYSHAANIGHLVKTRAATNYILYNRLTDEIGGADGPSYELDIPSGGLSYVIGNVFEKAPSAMNSSVFLNYATETQTFFNPTLELYVVNNTFVSDCGTNCGTGNPPTFIRARQDPTVRLINNIPWAGPGGGTLIATSVTPLVSHNLGITTDPLLENQGAYDYHLAAGSPAIDMGVYPEVDPHGYGLAPTLQYRYDAQSEARPVVGTIDIGAFESLQPPPTMPPTPCVGDCFALDEVTVDDLLTMVNIALGNVDLSACTAGDANHDGQITIDEVLGAANNVQNGCR